MPKLIDYPRTSYTGAWEVAETVDDTGGKCALETCARKLNRKVSGSFKAIVGSAVKFGLLVSKREILTTTTLFRRIKHAYDKQEELLFHREAFLTPALFTQICRKFRSRELPVAMLDVLLMREFGVEEINAQNVAKAFTDGARMVGLLDEHNVLADIDQLAAAQPPRRELASPTPPANVFRQSPLPLIPAEETDELPYTAPAAPPVAAADAAPAEKRPFPMPASRPAPAATSDAIAHLFNLAVDNKRTDIPELTVTENASGAHPAFATPSNGQAPALAQDVPTLAQTGATPTIPPSASLPEFSGNELVFRIQLVGPGLNTQLEVVDVDDLTLVRALLAKIERRLRQQ